MVPNSIDFHTLARAAASGIANSLFIGIAMAAVGWLTCRAVGGKSSRTRFLVWVITFIAILFTTSSSVLLRYSGASASSGAAGGLTLPDWFAASLVIAWMAGAMLGTLHIGHGLYRLRRLRASCTPVAMDQLDPTLRARLSEIQAQRTVRLCTSDAVRVPAAIGYFRPIVVFPSWALREIPVSELDAILIHELAHLRRYDDFTNLAQKLMKAILFFHPAVWFIESRLTLEREMACDDAVLEANVAPRAYAESLVSLAEKSFLRRGLQLAQAAVSHVEQLRLRLVEILRKDRVGKRSPGLRMPALAVLGVGFMVGGYGAANAPRLVSFADGSQETHASVPRKNVLSVREATLQPVDFRYETPAKHAAAAAKSRAKVIQRTEPKARPSLVQRASFDRVLTDEPGTQGTFISVSGRELAPRPVLVVLEGERFGTDGPVRWRLTVVHLTPAQQSMFTRTIPKQI